MLWKRKSGFQHMYSEDFKQHLRSRNRERLLTVLLMSLGLDAVYFIVTQSGFSELGIAYYGEGLPAVFDSFSGQGFLVLSAIYIAILLLLRFTYSLQPEVVSFLAMTFMLTQKVTAFLFGGHNVVILVYWVVIAVLLGWNYVGQRPFMGAVAVSYAYLVAGISMQTALGDEAQPILWTVSIVLVVVALISMRQYTIEYEKYFEVINEARINRENRDKLFYDNLTGLYSQYGIENYIEEKMGYESGYCYVLMDLDDMKRCNNLYGYEGGNVYIRLFGDIIRLLLKSSRDKIGRIGDNKFLGVILSSHSEDEIYQQLDRYNRLLKEEFRKQYSDGAFVPHFSYGAALVHRGDDFRDVYMRAETAMYQDKSINRLHLRENNYYQPNIDYLSLFEAGNITVCVWLPDRSLSVGFISPSVESLLGYTNEAFMEEPQLYKKCVHPNDLNRVLEEVNQNIEERKLHFEQSYRLVKADGSIIWVRDYSVTVWNDQELIQVNGYIYDVTLEVTAAEAIKDQSLLLEDIIEAAKVGTWQWDAKRDDVTFDDFSLELLGYDDGELNHITRQQWADTIHPEDQDTFLNAMEDHLAGRTPIYEVECRMRHKDGHYTWILDRGKVMKWTDEGEPWIVTGAQSDITENKETQALLNHSEKLNALGRLSGGIAHDMNNHLMMISSYLDLADEKQGLEDYRNSNRRIRDIVSRSSDIVGQLLKLSKHNLYEPKTMDLVAVIKEVADVMNHTLGKKIKVETVFEMEKLWLVGDPSMIENALINLCINARDAMKVGGKIRIGCSLEAVERPINSYTGHLAVGSYAMIFVEDQGTGIKDQELIKIFEPFYTTKQTGSGIGLSTVVSVVNQHGGGIQVASTYGEGTRFMLYLPLGEVFPDETTKDGIQTVITGNRALRVMIVDDEPVLSQVLVEYLEMKGCGVRGYTDPREALEDYRVNSDVLDVVILDMLMPDMSGDELFEKMHEINGEIKVLFLSGYSEGIEVKSKFRHNIIGFLEKPIHMEKIYELLQATVGNLTVENEGRA